MLSEIQEEMLKKTDILDLETFTQLIELDENEGTDFLESVAIDWFIQAEDTFIKMDKKLEEKELVEFSKLAHFLKGSSGQLGMKNLQHSCELMQNYGKLLDSVAKPTLTKEEATDKIIPALKLAKEEFAEAEKWLKKFLDPEKAEEEKKDPKKDPKEVTKEKAASPTPSKE